MQIVNAFVLIRGTGYMNETVQDFMANHNFRHETFAPM